MIYATQHTSLHTQPRLHKQLLHDTQNQKQDSAHRTENTAHCAQHSDGSIRHIEQESADNQRTRDAHPKKNEKQTRRSARSITYASPIIKTDATQTQTHAHTSTGMQYLRRSKHRTARIMHLAIQHLHTAPHINHAADSVPMTQHAAYKSRPRGR